jgi:hypothetical protein
MSRVASLVLGLCLAFAATASAQGTDFSGAWKLNLAQSSFGQMPAPSSLEQTITQDASTVKAAVKQVSDFGEMAFDFAFTTDGKESTNDAGGMQFKTVSKWDGPALLVDTTMDLQGSPLTMKDRWTLSADGKQLLVDRKVESPMGPGEAKIVFDKQ